MRAKLCFFVRNATDTVDMSKACDDTVIAGEISPSPLTSLESTLSKVYKPTFDKREDWGSAETEYINEFKGSVDKFVVEMQVRAAARRERTWETLGWRSG